MSDFDQLDLLSDYDKENDQDLSQFLSKPTPRKYQPFGGPMPEAPQPMAQEISYDTPAQEPTGYNVFGDELDAYGQAKKNLSYISSYASNHNQSASLYNKRYDDFINNKLKPFYAGFDEFNEYDDHDEYLNSLDKMYKSDLKISKQPDGFFGEPEGRAAARQRLGKFAQWNQPNGLKSQYLKLKAERDQRQALADQFNAQKIALQDQLTAIPMSVRMEMDNQLKSRGSSSSSSKKALNEYLDRQSFENPVVDYKTGEVVNLEATDPRRPISSFPDYKTGQVSKSVGAQHERAAAAARGDFAGVFKKRDLTSRDRQLRDRGVMFSLNGLQDGRPRGLSRRDVDALDLDEMRRVGMTEYNGRPLEEALNEIGGEERINMAKVMQAVYAAKNASRDAQLEFLKNAGGPKNAESKKKMDEAREYVMQTLSLASEFGLANEIFEQADTVGWLEHLGTAVQRGMMTSELGDYTDEILTGTLDLDDIQNMVELSSQIEKLPTTTSMERYKKIKSENFLDALGNILMNPGAATTMFVESMASFLPSTFKAAMTAVPVAAAGGALYQGLGPGKSGLIKGVLQGTGIGVSASWGLASFNLEAVGSVMESLRELGIDDKDPFVLAAALDSSTNPVLFNKIRDKALKRGIPIALMDSLSAGMAGKMNGLRELGLNGGKMIDGASWAQNIKYAEKNAPRFTKFQKVTNAATELGADSLSGMSGELLAQIWANEAGEPLNYDDIAAEGIIGTGPGIVGATVSSLRSASNDFTETDIQYQNMQVTPDGSTGVINRAGYTAPYNTYNSADGMTSGLLELSGISDENLNDIDIGRKAAAVQDWVANLWRANPEKMKNLRVIVSDRTPSSDMTMPGTFERDLLGNGVIYLNRTQFNNDPIGAFFHEAGHLARDSMFNDEQLLTIYDGLSYEEKLSAFAEQEEYGVRGKMFSEYSEAEQKQIQKRYKQLQKKGPLHAADEWFSMQFVNILAGGKVDKSVKTEMQSWLRKYAFPFLKKYAGSEKLGGSMKDQLSAKILEHMGRSPSGKKFSFKNVDSAGTRTNFNAENMRAPEGSSAISGLSDMEGLNFLVGRIKGEFTTPKERANFAKDFNTFVGKNALDTNTSFWTDREVEVATAVEKDRDSSLDQTYGDQEIADMSRTAQLLPRGRVQEMKEVDFAEPEIKETGEGAKERAPKEPELFEVEVEDPDKSLPDVEKEIEEVGADGSVVKKKVKGRPTKKVKGKIVKKTIKQTLAGDDKKTVTQIELPDGTVRDLTPGELNKYKEKPKVPDIPKDKPQPGIVGRSPYDTKREKSEWEKGNRFRVTLSTPGLRGKVETKYFKTRAEATKAAKEFENEFGRKALKNTLKKQAAMKATLADPKKFKALYNKTKKALGEGASIAQIIEKAFGLKDLMSNSLFGDLYAARHLAEDKVHSDLGAKGERGIVKMPSIIEIEEDLYLSQAEHDEALKLLQNREAELVRGLEADRKNYATLTTTKAPSFATDKEKELWTKASENGDQKTLSKLADKWIKKGDSDYKFDTVEVVNILKDKKTKQEFVQKIVGGKFKNIGKLTKKNRAYFKETTQTDMIDPAAISDKKIQAQLKKYRAKLGKKSYQIRFKVSKKKQKKKDYTKVESFSPLRKLVNLEKEIKDAEKTLKFVREYREALIPESKAFMWSEMPHPSYYVDAGGKRTNMRMKLGALNTGPNKNITYWSKNKDGEWKKNNLSNGQATLLQFIENFKPGERKDWDFLGSDISKSDYIVNVKSIRAGMLNPTGTRNEPMTYIPKTKDEDGDLVEGPNKARSIGGFQSEKGTTYFAYAIQQAIDLERKAKNRIDLMNSDPSLDEQHVISVALGKNFESRNELFESTWQYRYKALTDRMFKEAGRRIEQYKEELKKLDAGDKEAEAIEKSIENLKRYQKSLVPRLDDIYNSEAFSARGAEENPYFPKVQGGKPFSGAFDEWDYFHKREEAIEDYFNYVESDLAERYKNLIEYKSDKFPDFEGTDPDATDKDLIEKASQTNKKRTAFEAYIAKTYKNEQNPGADSVFEWLKQRQLDYIEHLEGKLDEKKEDAKKKRPLFPFYQRENIDTGPDVAESSFKGDGPGWQTYLNQSIAPDSKGRTQYVKSFDDSGFDYREIGEEADDKIPAREQVHGGFVRGNVDEGFDVMAAARKLAKGNPEKKKQKKIIKELQKRVARLLKGDVSKENISTKGKDGEVRTKEEITRMAKEQAKRLQQDLETAVRRFEAAEATKEDPNVVNIPSRLDLDMVSDFVAPESGYEVTYTRSNGDDMTVVWKLNEEGDGDWYLKTNKDKTFRQVIAQRISELRAKQTPLVLQLKKDEKVEAEIADLDRQITVWNNDMQYLNDTYMEEVDQRLLSADKRLDLVSAADVAKFFWNGQGVLSDLTRLEQMPSSKKPKGSTLVQSMPGAPGGGFLLFVWDDFIKSMYKKLNIKNFKVDYLEKKKDTVDPLGEASKDTLWEGKSVRITVDANGRAVLYDSTNKSINLKDDQLASIVQNAFGKDRKAVAKDLEKLNTKKGKKKAAKKAKKKQQRKEAYADSFEKKQFRYEADNQYFYVNGKLRDDSLFNREVPSYEYVQATLAPIFQAVVDARRVDIFGTSKRKDKTIMDRDMQKHTSDQEKQGDANDDTPEGFDADFEEETRTDKDMGKTKDSDFEESEGEGIKDKLDPSINADDIVTKNLNKNEKTAATIRQLLFNLKSGGRKVSVGDVVKQFQGADEQVEFDFWKAFGMDVPPKNMKLYGYAWQKKIKESKLFPVFKARVLDSKSPFLGARLEEQTFSLKEKIKSVDQYNDALSLMDRLFKKTGSNAKSRQELGVRLNALNGGKPITKHGFMNSLVDNSRAATKPLEDILKDLGASKALKENLDIHALWHQYFGKTDEVVKQSELIYIEPIKEALRNHNVTNREFGEYLIARIAPSKNIHLKELYKELMAEAKGETKKNIQKTIKKHGDALSGVKTATAIKVVQSMEKDPNFKAFLDDPSNPLQTFYDMNMSSLNLRNDGGLIQSGADINERTAMINASSYFNWKKQGGSKYMYKSDGKESAYSYAPMQGFDGQTERLNDLEEVYQIAGKSSSSSGRAWDQPKQQFLFEASYGRDAKSVGPDPEMVFSVAQSQYFDGALRAHKNEVAQAYGRAFELMRAVAFYGQKNVTGLPIPKLDSFEGGKDLEAKIKQDPTISENLRERVFGVDGIFEKDFQELTMKNGYEVKEQKIEFYDEDGKKREKTVDGLKFYRREMSEKLRNDPLTFVYRKNGVPMYIKFKQNKAGMQSAASLKNLNFEALPGPLQTFAWFTRNMAQLFTSKNPAFLFPNFARDLLTAAIHLSEDDKVTLMGKALDPKRIALMMKDIAKVEVDTGNKIATKLDNLPKDPKELAEYGKNLSVSGDYKRLYQFYKQSGGKVGYFRSKPLTELIADVQELTGKPGKAKEAWMATLNYLDAGNTAIENSIRLASFSAALEQGRSAQEAAKIARNITVDFNQKGTFTQTLGSMFVFFGASVNSTHRLFKTLHTRGLKKSIALISSIAGASALHAILQRMLNYDEDEEAEPKYDKINSFLRDTNVTFAFEDGSNARIPLPLGYNIFWALGQTVGDIFSRWNGKGGGGPVEWMERNAQAIVNATNPLASGSWGTFMVPTPIVPIVELANNRNFMGAEIRKEDRDFEPSLAAYMNDPKRTEQYWTEISKWVNTMLGGSEAVKGSFSSFFGYHPLEGFEDSVVSWNVSGSQLEHLMTAYLGGPGQILNSFIGSAIAPMISDKIDYKAPEINNIPIINRFYRSSVSNSSLKNMYYQLRDKKLAAEKQLRISKAVSSKEYNQHKNALKDFIALDSYVKRADSLRKKIRDSILKVEQNDSLSRLQKSQRIAELEKKENNAYIATIKKARALGIVN
jgi:hypothetical protein